MQLLRATRCGVADLIHYSISESDFMSISTAVILCVVLLVKLAAIRFFIWYAEWMRHAERFSESGYVPPLAGWTSRTMFYLASRLLTFLTVGKVKVLRCPAVPYKGRVIFAANHQLPCDFAMVRLAAGRHMRMLTASSQLGGFFGVLAAWFGVISIAFKSKSDGAAAEEACVKAVAEKDGCLGIFPQGALLPDNVLNPCEFRPGAVRIAQKVAAQTGEEVFIVPVAVYYERNPAKADWTHCFLKKARANFLGMRDPKYYDPIFKIDLSTLTETERARVEAERKEAVRKYKRSHVTNYGGVVVAGAPIPVSSLPSEPLEAIEVIRKQIAALLNVATNNS